ncbi:MAG: transglycosylase SLT domain-containing protein [Magnetococcus sp. WYHC-3]
MNLPNKAKIKQKIKNLLLIALGIVIGVSYSVAYAGYLDLSERITIVNGSGIAATAVVHATPAVEAEAQLPSPEREIKAIAEEEGVDYKLLMAICEVESNCNPDRVGDSGNSHGMFQIHLPSHPDITPEQAKDIEFSTRWTIKHCKQFNDNPEMKAKCHNGIGKQNQWYVDRVMKIYKS